MKFAIIVLSFLLAIPFIVAHGDHGNYVKPPYTCRLRDGNGGYCLRRLYKSDGNAWSSIDTLGNTIYFNLCGDLSTDVEGTTGCDPSAASCVYTSMGTYINAGRPTDDSLSLSVSESEDGEDSNIQFTYSNGDVCPNSESSEGESVNYQTIIQLTCDPTVANMSINSVNYNSTTCTVSVEASSMYACKRTGHWKGRGSHAWFLIFPLLCCCSICICIAACCRRHRRRCAQRKLEMNTYTAVPQQETIQSPQQPQFQPQQMMQPYIIPTQFPSQNSSQQFQPQYFQPSPYYVYMPQYPQQQQQNAVPVAPVIPLEETVIEQRENIVENDEKIARELQAKFDNE